MRNKHDEPKSRSYWITKSVGFPLHWGFCLSTKIVEIISENGHIVVLCINNVVISHACMYLYTRGYTEIILAPCKMKKI